MSLHKPFTALTSDRLASLTKDMLHRFGISNMFGPHSTRGASVAFYKRLGLTTEQVAELGKWKDIKTFSQYYLRLQAAESASRALSFFVHTVSPLDCAEPDMSHSPPRKSFEGGRSDMEGEAQDKGEPTHSTLRKRCHSPLMFPNKRQSLDTGAAHGVLDEARPAMDLPEDPKNAADRRPSAGQPQPWPLAPSLPIRFQFASSPSLSRKKHTKMHFVSPHPNTNKKQ